MQCNLTPTSLSQSPFPTAGFNDLPSSLPNQTNRLVPRTSDKGPLILPLNIFSRGIKEDIRRLYIECIEIDSIPVYDVTWFFFFLCAGTTKLVSCRSGFQCS